jgi:hypothetical protein
MAEQATLIDGITGGTRSDMKAGRPPETPKASVIAGTEHGRADLRASCW